MTDHDTGGQYRLTYISLGAGVQSTALAVLSARGEKGVPRADVAIFADTGDEPPHVYDQLERLRGYLKPYGMPVETVSIGISLSEAMRSR